MEPVDTRTCNVLCVEDNAADRRLIREFFTCKRTKCVLHFVEDGAEALDFVLRRGEHREVPVPDLVILDLNLPKQTGLEVLRVVKQDPNLKHIPIVVFTSSANPDDIAQTYDLHANAYLVKPGELEAFEKVMEMIETFWLESAELPPMRDCA